MILNKNHAEKLQVLGFSLPNSRLRKHQQIWWIQGIGPFDCEEYCAGGRLSPDAPSLISSFVAKHGIWLPTVSELLLWLQLKEFSLDMKTNRGMTSIVIQHQEGCKYHADAETMEAALFLVVVQILESKTVPEFNILPKTRPGEYGSEIQFNLILKRSGKGIMQRIIKKIGKNIEEVSLKKHWMGCKPYLSRHDPSEIMIALSSTTQVSEVQKLYDCSWQKSNAASSLQQLYECTWQKTETSVTWDSLEHPEEICVDKAVDWASISTLTFYHDENCTREVCNDSDDN